VLLLPTPPLLLDTALLLPTPPLEEDALLFTPPLLEDEDALLFTPPLEEDALLFTPPLLEDEDALLFTPPVLEEEDAPFPPPPSGVMNPASRRPGPPLVEAPSSTVEPVQAPARTHKTNGARNRVFVMTMACRRRAHLSHPPPDGCPRRQVRRHAHPC